MSRGEITKAMEVAMNMNDPHLVECMRYMAPGTNISNYAEDIAVVFRMIGDIKAEQTWTNIMYGRIIVTRLMGATHLFLKRHNIISKQP